MKKSDRIISVVVLSVLVFLLIVLYTAGLSNKSGRSVRGGSNLIAIIELNGMILTPEKFIEEFQKFAKRRDIRGIVLRINSPGGDVAASQEIYSAVKRVRDSGKPVVASIGSAGASGAYLVALGANKIVANPGSITGSIGVIIDFPVVVNLMKKIGVEMKVVKSGEYKDVGSPFKQLEESDRAHLKNVVDDLQSQFVDVVVNERHLPKNNLVEIADGRIFTGSQAVQLGLIDTLGTLEDAITLTGRLAGMTQKPETVISKKKKKSLLDLLFSDVEEVASMTTQTPAIEYLWK